MFYALINAVQELDRKIDLLVQKQKKIDELEKEVKSLKVQNIEIKKRLDAIEKSLR